MIVTNDWNVFVYRQNYLSWTGSRTLEILQAYDLVQCGSKLDFSVQCSNNQFCIFEVIGSSERSNLSFINRETILFPVFNSTAHLERSSQVQ